MDPMKAVIALNHRRVITFTARTVLDSLLIAHKEVLPLSLLEFKEVIILPVLLMSI
jgi:hypothetical protein